MKIHKRTQLKVNTSVVGHRLAHRIQSMQANGEPLTATIETYDMAPTAQIEAAYNIKTNKFDVMREAMGKVAGWEMENMLKGAEAPEEGGTDGTES